MADKDIHYLSYDPDAIWLEIMQAYVEAGGDILYPGDEKEMIMRAVQAVAMHIFAGADAAMRMNTLRYASGDYLDLIGDSRYCERLEAEAARTTIRISLRATNTPSTIPPDETLTADGSIFFTLDQEVYHTGDAQEIECGITCIQPGSIGNGLMAGSTMHFVNYHPGVERVVVVADASGGSEQETDENYRERIRISGLTPMTTGTAAQYETIARAVSEDIQDASALQTAPGVVCVYLNVDDAEKAQALLPEVHAAINNVAVRTLTDQVSAALAEEMPWELHVSLMTTDGVSMAAEALAIAEDYRQWQDSVNGRAFNPDRLKASLYQAGAMRVAFGVGSHFNHGNADYTEILKSQRCRGRVTIEVMT